MKGMCLRIDGSCAFAFSRRAYCTYTNLPKASLCFAVGLKALCPFRASGLHIHQPTQGVALLCRWVFDVHSFNAPRKGKSI